MADIRIVLNKVKLLATDDPEDEEVGDYINANFIPGIQLHVHNISHNISHNIGHFPGFHSKREFIATQVSENQFKQLISSVASINS